MAKAVFYVKDKVQDVGYRLFIISKLLNSDLEGTAVNTPDGRIKVLLEGEKDHIIQFYEELKKEKPKLSENPTTSKMEFDESLVVPKVMRSSQDLLVGQFQKGVTFLGGMNGKLDGMNGKLDGMNNKLGGINNKLEGIGQKLSDLPEKIAGRLENKLDQLPERIAGRIENKLDQLPERIAGRIENKLDELPERIAGRIENKLDQLPERIAKAIRG
ncbi:acylphosphatase [archaeon]|nr:acylphosphatase [archaeon]